MNGSDPTCKLTKGKVYRISKGKTTLFQDITSKMAEDHSYEIVKGSDGFYLRLLERVQTFLVITQARFFLEKDIEIHLGNPHNPEKILKVTSLNFPKLRVNFNGYRLKTREKNNNWSTFYIINEEEEDPPNLCFRIKKDTNRDLKVNNIKPEDGKEEKDGQVVFSDLKKRYIISNEPGADIKIQENWKGAIMFIEDIGWVLKSDSQESENLNKFYGAFLKVGNLEDKFKEFKLYEGMRLLLSNHMFEVTEVH